MYYLLLDKIKENFWVFTITASAIALFANFLGTISTSYVVFFVAFLIGILLIVLIFFNPVYSILVNWICSYVLSFIFYAVLKVSSVPLGFIFEIVNFFGFFVLLFRKELIGFDTKIGKLFLLWLLICLIQLFNPFAASRVAWFFAIRQLFFILVPFFVIYSLLVFNKKTLKYLFMVWISFSLLAAFYTLYQEHVGVPGWHYAFIASNEKLLSLMMTFGRLRKMAFFPGPMENAMVLTFNAVICLGLAFQREIKRENQILLLLGFILSAWAMIYTGTRTATVLFVFGVAVYVILCRRRELLIMAGAFVFLAVAYVVLSGGGGQAVYVMTTAFRPEEDPSMMVRVANQVMLRNYLYQSPIGFGLGSTGYIGMKFSPHTFLGSFPPDSELVRIVIETGIIGLSIYLFIMFSFLKTALDTLSFDSGPFSNNLKMIIVTVLFMFLLGQYPQEILNVSPLKILFAFFLAYVSLTKEQMEALE